MRVGLMDDFLLDRKVLDRDFFSIFWWLGQFTMGKIREGGRVGAGV
jgi:hypothetical protein